jgi:ribosomal-protein-alanine N-acetyltransferase
MTMDWNNGSERYRFAVRDDLADIAEILVDPDIGRWLWFTPGTRETFVQYFAPLVDAQTAQLERGEIPHTAVFVVDDQDGRFLGQGAAVAVDASPGGFEIGFQLRREAWGRGVATRLAQFLCAYAVHQCDAYRIEGACLDGNTGSRAILTHLGLTLEGTRPSYRVRDTVRRTELLYGAEVRALDTASFRRVAEAFGLVTPQSTGA